MQSSIQETNSQNQQDWEIVIGCEVHIQVKSNSKLFSGGSTDFGQNPNSGSTLFDIATPGMLPVMNKFVIQQAIKTGLAINAKVNNISIFDRKHYFYPDLPQGYQISQFYKPIVSDGYITIQDAHGNDKNIQIEHIHLEQDAGKLIHDIDPKNTLIDFNRSGIALMELVTKPDFRSKEEVANFIKELRLILRYINSSDADMEKGQLRCDANISVRKKGDDKFGTRCEIKNLNSIKFIADAIEYESQLQIKTLENDGVVEQTTKLYDINTGTTKVMRSKEDAMDYRYFPDPDLPPLNISNENIDEVKKTMPELPTEKRNRYQKLNISLDDANVIISNLKLSHYIDPLLKKHSPSIVISWINSELLGRLKALNLNITDNPISVDNFSQLLSLIEKQVISGKIAKDVLDIMLETPDKSPNDIVEEKNLKQIQNPDEITNVINKIIENNPKQYQDYKNGKEKLFAFFVGQVMKETKGKADPQLVNKILKEKL